MFKNLYLKMKQNILVF